MALFSAEDLLRDNETEHEIAAKNGFKKEGTEEHFSLYITVKKSRSLIKEVKKIRDKATTVEAFQKSFGKRRGDIEITTDVDHSFFVSETLKKTYARSTGDVVDDHSLDIILALIEEHPLYEEWLSTQLLNVFQGGRSFAQTNALKEDDDAGN